MKDKKINTEDIIEKGITLFQEINDIDGVDKKNEVFKQIAIVLMENGDDDALNDLFFTRDRQRSNPDQKNRRLTQLPFEEHLEQYLEMLKELRATDPKRYRAYLIRLADLVIES